MQVAPDSPLVPLVQQVLLLREDSPDFCISPERPPDPEDQPSEQGDAPGTAPIQAPAAVQGGLLHGSRALLPAPVDPNDLAALASERRKKAAEGGGSRPAGRDVRRAPSCLTGAAHQQYG
jgi:hypothetical protein